MYPQNMIHIKEASSGISPNIYRAYHAFPQKPWKDYTKKRHHEMFETGPLLELSHVKVHAALNSLIQLYSAKSWMFKDMILN